MVVQGREDCFLLIRQTDHAALSGEFAAEWGNEKFARPEPFESFRLAAAEHDNGWREWDESPRIDPAAHEPWQFTAMPVADHLSFYQYGIKNVLKQDLYAGLLVSMHCTGIYSQRYGTDPTLKLERYSPEMEAIVKGFRERMEGQQKHLREQLGAAGKGFGEAEERALWANYKRLQMVDRLSLYLCMAPPAAGTLGPAPLDEQQDAQWQLRPSGGNKVTIAPYPFRREALKIGIKARRIPRKSYRDDAELREALGQAKEELLEFTICAK
jgi:hypothetical protein